jgi:hypothetical protein
MEAALVNPLMAMYKESVKSLINIQQNEALSFNHSAKLLDHGLKALILNDGDAPRPIVNGETVVFPPQLKHLKSLTGEQVDAFLIAYDQSTYGSINARKIRLGCHIGVDRKLIRQLIYSKRSFSVQDPNFK